MFGLQRRRAHGCAVVGGQHINDAGGKARLFQNLVEEKRGVHGSRGRLPQHRIAHQGRGRREVALDGGEVEGRDGQHKAFERPYCI